MASTDFNRKNILSTIPTTIENLKTTLQGWANGRFSLTSHTHSASSIGIPLFAPDFSRRKKLYSSGDDASGNGFRIRNVDDTTTIYNAKIFQLKYPCFIYTQVTTFSQIDTDILLEIAQTEKGCLSACHTSPERYLAAVLRDSTYRNIFVTSDSSTDSALLALGTVGWWHHYVTGASESSDSGDHKYRDYYLIPAYGTPQNTELAVLYDATYKGKKYPKTSGGSADYWLCEFISKTGAKSIKA